MKNQRIAVFDFNANDCDYTAEAIGAYYKGQGLEMPEITTWTEDLPFRLHVMDMADRNAHYDMMFIGADTMKGADVAHMIRIIDKGCPLFLVSSSVELAVEGFRLQALDYLTKPASSMRVGEAIARINTVYTKGGDET